MTKATQKVSPQMQVTAALEQCLLRYVPRTASICVAFSGGADSMVLLHALRLSAGDRTVRALHVDHGLQPDSGAWADACRRTCLALNIPFTLVHAEVDLAAGLGLEAAARESRYAAIEAQLAQGEVLVTAHHQRDQLETMLLRLLRGAGVHGLASMPVHSWRGTMELLRPLLAVPADIIRAYAVAEQLDWIDDPSNTDLSMDRNFLRHEILPAILGRWNAAEKTVARAARLCAESAALLDEIAQQDLAGILDGHRLNLDGLKILSAARQRNAIRHVLHLLDLAIPSEKQLTHALTHLMEAKCDGQPEAAWPGVRIRRFRQQLWFYPENTDPLTNAAPAETYLWNPAATLSMGNVRGTLVSTPAHGAGIAAEYCAKALQVKFRQGGERLRINRNGRTRELKNLLQEMGVVPWMRGHIPLIYSDDQLVAVGDIWVNADFAAHDGASGQVITWKGHSQLR
jgi:tRNA(Ile)-lysidine synthase